MNQPTSLLQTKELLAFKQSFVCHCEMLLTSDMHEIMHTYPLYLLYKLFRGWLFRINACLIRVIK